MRKILAVILAVLLLAMVPSQALAADWGAAFKDSRHTSSAGDALAPPLAPVWAAKTGGQVVCSPVVSGNTVYFGDEENCSVIALDLATGKTRWIFRTNGAIEGTPTVVNDTVVAGSYDGYVYRLRASDGSLMWKAQVGSGMYSSPLVYAGRVYIGTDNSGFYALDLSTGSVAWKLMQNTTQGSPAGDGGKVFIGTLDGRVYALDAATGKVDWTYDTGSSIHSSPMVYDGKVYIASRGGVLYAFSEDTGDVKWKANLGYLTDSTPSLDLEGKAVIIGTFGGYVKAYDAANGSLRWISAYIKPIYATVAISGDTVYGVTQDGWLFGLNRTDGSTTWGLDMGEFTFSSPAVVEDYLLIGTLSDHLAAFRPVSIVSTPSPSSVASADTALPDVGGALSGTSTYKAKSPFPGFVAVLGALAVALVLARRR